MTITERPPLSARQYRIYSFIALYIDTYGWAPNYREIGAACGLKSTSSISHQLNALEARGYVKRGRSGSYRTLSVIA